MDNNYENVSFHDPEQEHPAPGKKSPAKRPVIRDRAEDTRKFEQRDMEIRSNLKMSNKSTLYVDPKYIPEGKEACYIRDSLLGNPDYYSLDEAASKGWDAVTSEQIPAMASKFSHGGHAPHYIRKRELILHFRDKVYGDIERQNKQTLNNQSMETLPGQDHFMDDPSMPMKVFHNQRSRSN